MDLLSLTSNDIDDTDDHVAPQQSVFGNEAKFVSKSIV